MNPAGFAGRRFQVGLVLAVQYSFSTDWEESVEGKSLWSFGPPSLLSLKDGWRLAWESRAVSSGSLTS